MAIRTIKEWLKAKVAEFDLSDLTIESILIDNGVACDTRLLDASEKQKDLTLADVYMALATSPSKSGSIYDADGGWQKGRATKNVVDREWFRKEANRLYLKWNSPKATTYGEIVLKKLYR